MADYKRSNLCSVYKIEKYCNKTGRKSKKCRRIKRRCNSKVSKRR